MEEDNDRAEREAEQKADTAERLEEHRFVMPMFAAFMAASMASGNDPKKAAGHADLALLELKSRFT